MLLEVTSAQLIGKSIGTAESSDSMVMDCEASHPKSSVSSTV